MIAPVAAMPTSERALTMFEAFLRHARSVDGPPSPAPPGPPPRADRAPVSDDDATLDSEVTRVVQTPSRPPAPAELPSWDDRTEESAGPSTQATVDERTDLAVKLPLAPVQVHASHVEERSIIIDDDSLTSPEMSRDDALAAAPSALAAPIVADPLGALLQEMAVLVKYGHAAQVAQELDLWSQSHPDDLAGHMRVAEFEMARVDRERALQRYGTLVSMFLDRGDTRSADDVLRRLRRDMPGDPRVTAIAQWNGLS